MLQRGVRALVLATAALALVGSEGAPAIAGPLSVLFGKSEKARLPLVARFTTSEVGGFVLDRSQANFALLKFDDQPEVRVLHAFPAARGDLIFRDDRGDLVLRAARVGGLTLFTVDRPGGVAAALVGQTDPIHLGPMSAGILLRRLGQASVRASRAARHLIEIDAQEVSPGEESLFADAASVSCDAIIRLSQTRKGKVLVARLDRVLLRSGPRISVNVVGRTLLVIVNPTDGLAGRPSSDVLTVAMSR